MSYYYLFLFFSWKCFCTVSKQENEFCSRYRANKVKEMYKNRIVGGKKDNPLYMPRHQLFCEHFSFPTKTRETYFSNRKYNFFLLLRFIFVLIFSPKKYHRIVFNICPSLIQYNKHAFCENIALKRKVFKI